MNYNKRWPHRNASRDVMRAPSWWDDAKTPIAFLIAPLAVPLVTVWILSAPLDGLDRGTTLIVSTFAAYLGVFLALPVYLYLRGREEMTFLLAPIIGFAMGVITAYVVYFLFGYTLIGSLADSIVRRDAFGFGGPSAAVVGAILWLIARPDRPEE
jgi:hypothetical protein